VRWLALALLLAPAMASAQHLEIGQVIRNLDKIKPANPLEGPANPPQNSREGALGEPVIDPNALDIIRAGTFDREGDIVRIGGGTEFTYRGYRIFADEAEGDLRVDIFELKGNVKVISADSIVYGDRVVVDFPRNFYRAESGNATLKPSVIQGQFREDLYVRSRASEGSQRESWHYDSCATTCNLDHPHFSIDARETNVRPGRRIIFRDAKIRVFGATIIQIPYLSIPLDSYRYKYLPEVGQSRDEGYFIKNRYGVPLRGDDTFYARLDYMTKLGVGYGGDWGYRSRQLEGLLKVYALGAISNALSVSNTHRQRLSFGELALDTDFQRNNYLTAPGSTILSNRMALNIPTRSGNTNINFARSSSAFSGSQSVSQNVSVADDRRFGPKTSTSLQVAWNQSSNSYAGASDFTSENLDLRFRATQDLTKANALLEYQRNIPVGDAGNFFGGSDRTPVITLTSDANRLLDRKTAAALPFRTSLSWGEFGGLAGDRISRSYFDVSMNKSGGGRGRLRLDYGGQFRQGFYSDGTAQYVVGGNFNTAYQFGRDTSFNVRYQYLRPEGYTPIGLDRSGRTHYTTMDVSVRPQRYVLVGAQTGYDFNRAKQSDVGWQQVGLRADFVPRQDFQLRTLTTYDTFSQIWSSFRADLTYKPGETYLSIGARYDGFQKQWSNANLFLNNFKVGRTRFSAILSYNGFTKQFDATQYNFVYDLHCWEAVLNINEYRTGFRAGTEFQVFFRLKALPSSSGFGIGTRGQPLGTNVGGF